MASLCSESSRAYLGRSVRVPVSRARPKDGATEGNRVSCVQKSAEAVVPTLHDQGRRKGPKGHEQVRVTPVSQCRSCKGRTAVWRSIIRGDGRDSRAWGLVSASALKLVLNRLVRTRMLGGVGGAPEQSGPLSRSIVTGFPRSISPGHRRNTGRTWPREGNDNDQHSRTTRTRQQRRCEGDS